MIVGNEYMRSLQSLYMRSIINICAPCNLFSFLKYMLDFGQKNSNINFILQGVNAKVNTKQYRAVAQPGSALDWGSRGRWFKSSLPEIKTAKGRLYALKAVIIFSIETQITFTVIFYYLKRRQTHEHSAHKRRRHSSSGVNHTRR